MALVASTSGNGWTVPGGSPTLADGWSCTGPVTAELDGVPAELPYFAAKLSLMITG